MKFIKTEQKYYSCNNFNREHNNFQVVDNIYMMWKIQILLIILPLLVNSEPENVQMTRTSIKVARNLDPNAMETLEVKTRTGDVATIVIKKRDGRQHFPEPTVKSETKSITPNTKEVIDLPDPVVIRSDSVFVKNKKEDEKKSRSLFHVDTDGIPVITGVREPDDENDHQIWRNARVINGILVPNTNKTEQKVMKEEYKPVASMFNGVWQVYKKKPESDKVQIISNNDQKFTFQDAIQNENYMTDKILGYIKNINGDILSNDRRTARMVEPQAEARVLHAPSVSVFPNSAMYSPPKKVSKVSFEESARTPVLQYAHPELGIQAAKYVPPEETPRDGRRQQALAHFSHDIHADRSPFAFEPGLEKESRVKVPKKYSPYYNFPEKHGKYAPNYFINEESSLWTIMKDKMKSSLDQVTYLTKPVVDPLVEATHKITGNLGLSNGNRELTNVVKEKLGMVATPSVLLPALGLVAGGAALGLGAVAVGRYLDYDVVKMRNNDDYVELQRTLNNEKYQPLIILSEKDQTVSTTEQEQPNRSRRSLHYLKQKDHGNHKQKKVKLNSKYISRS
ncbi:uncharacterized protein LOC126910541 [Daktulosphaira vitifoliae]|uniref:uncharacterized protein LOC126910541 n=1 Tax=Daktulosphaira vitifoliae TaxID=58002 RepID=UPI0021AA6456|nr:uncharacterized protein LOC126910541 [Daktulosphaira vitifoliae]